MNLRTAPEMLKVRVCGSWGGVSDANAANDANVCSPVYDKHDNPLTSEEEEQRAIAKIKMLGNIKFIGELGKLDLIHESILHKCIKTVSVRCCGGVGGQTGSDCCLSSPQLLEKKKRVQLKDMGEDLECLCQIMRTVGPRLDHEKAKVGVTGSRGRGVFVPGLTRRSAGSAPAGGPHSSFLLSLLSPVFNGSVLCPDAILNEQQGVAGQDPLPAARHSGTARKQLGPPQGFH